MQKINKDLLKPTTLIPDAADAIKNSFTNIFASSYNQIMCWTHTKRKVDNRGYFINYFHNEWLKTNDGWYEGIQVYSPSTNNALEATSRTIKDDGTFRERHVLSRFLTIASNIVNNWSIERDITSINENIFVTEPTTSLELWTLSYQ
ncbi:unnamed protein product [Rotaria sp. Silwood2]|nr:unnamed protein product [Rotaria sp. Silwood2]CAF4012020.1 unnamed protein product [Rotaria sp. Silwood2]